MNRIELSCCVLAMAAGMIVPAGAQTAPAPLADPSSQDPATPDGEEIIVTGRAGSTDRTKLETSYAVTTLSNEALRSRAASSVTEMLKSVPGFWVEASGGEGSGNVRARGIPVDGFRSINLLEDGLPVQHDPALGFLNADQAFRIDESIERIEVVRGGPSSVFEPNAPGGVVNYITRRPGDVVSGNARILYGPTADLYRIDGWFGGPLGNGFTLDFGGFWRDENGVRDPGYTGNKGGQGRVTLAKEFGKGRIALGYKRLADNAIFYAGIPLTKNANGDIVGIAGFHPRYGTTASHATRFLTLRNAQGSVQFDNTDGTEIRLDQFSALSDFDFGDGWNLSAKVRYRDSFTVRNGVFPVAVVTAANFVTANRTALLAASPGATGVLLRYTDGSPFDVAGQNGNGHVFQNAARPVTVDESEFLANVRLSREFELFGQTHCQPARDLDPVSASNIDPAYLTYAGR